MSDIVERRQVELWTCPDCAFSFDALHEDEGGGYTCPVCEVERLRTEIELLHAELRVTKKLGLAALQDAMRQARTGEER